MYVRTLASSPCLCHACVLPAQSFQRQYFKDKETLGENLKVIHAKCDSGPPGIWKVASQVASTAEDVTLLKSRTADAQVSGCGMVWSVLSQKTERGD